MIGSSRECAKNVYITNAGRNDAWRAELHQELVCGWVIRLLTELGSPKTSIESLQYKSQREPCLTVGPIVATLP